LNEKEFITSQSKKIKSEGIRIFPENFCDLSDTKKINLPEENLVLGKDFFGSYEITTTNGESVLNVEDQSEAKFIVYSSKKRTKQIEIPKDSKLITESVKKYESYLDELLIKIRNNCQKENLEVKNIGIISGEIFKKLNLTRL
jgi:hypothetical protein